MINWRIMIYLAAAAVGLFLLLWLIMGMKFEMWIVLGLFVFFLMIAYLMWK